MPFRLTDFERKNDGEDVVLIHRGSALQVRFSAWDARVLPFVDGAADHADVVSRAKAAGLKVPLDHVKVVVDRLQKAAILTDVASEPMALGDGDTPPSGAALNIVNRADLVYKDPLPAPEPKPVPVLDEEPRSEREELEAVISKGQENLRRELRRMNKPLEYAPIPVVQSRKPAAKTRGAGMVDVVPSAKAPVVAPVVDVPEELPEAEAPVEESAEPAVEGEADAQPLPTAASFREAEARAAALNPKTPAEPVGPPWYVRNSRALKRMAVLIVALGVVSVIPLPAKRTASVVIAPLELSELRATANATVEKVHVQLGDRVEEGALLVTLQSPEFVQSVKDFEEQVNADDEELRKLSLGDRPDVVRQEQVIKERSEAAKIAIAEFQKAQALGAEGKMSAAKVMDAEVALTAAKRSLVEAHAKLNDLKQLDLPAEIRGRAQLLERAKQKLSEEKAKLAALELKAPKAGTVVSLNATGAVGARVLSGDILVAVGQVEQMRVVFRFPEEEAPYLSSGKPMELSLDNGSKFPVRLSKLGFSRPEANAREFTVEAVVDNTQHGMRNGMSGKLEVPVGYAPLFKRVLAKAE